MTFRTLLAIAVAGSILPTGAQGRSTGNWQTYTNVRYGYRTCYPATLLRAQPEPDNSDGRTFKGTDGGELLVFGSNNVDQSTLSQEASEQARSYLGKRGKIGYRAEKAGWVVISGDDGAETEFYTKTFRRADQFLGFQVKYPKVHARLYRSMVERLNRCFVLLTPAY